MQKRKWKDPKTLNGTYCGGYPGIDKKLEGHLWIDDENVEFRIFRKKFVIPFSNVINTYIDTYEDTEMQLTKTSIAIYVATDIFIPQKVPIEISYYAIDFYLNESIHTVLFRPEEDNQRKWDKLLEIDQILRSRIGI